MAYISLIVPSFYSSSTDIQLASTHFSKQLGIDPAEYDIFPIKPASSENIEFGVRLLHSTLSLSNIEDILYHRESMKVFLDKTFESMRSMMSRICLLEMELKEQSDNRVGESMIRKDEIDDTSNNAAHKLKDLISMQLESSESFRLNTERTLSKIKEEFELIVSEFEDIKRLDSQRPIVSNYKIYEEQNLSNRETTNDKQKISSVTSRGKNKKDTKQNQRGSNASNSNNNYINSGNPSPNIVKKNSSVPVHTISQIPQLNLNINLTNINSNNVILEHDPKTNQCGTGTNDVTPVSSIPKLTIIPKLNFKKVQD